MASKMIFADLKLYKNEIYVFYIVIEYEII